MPRFDAYVPGGVDVAVADGGTGASTAAAAAENLGVGLTDSPTFAGLTLSAGGALSVATSGTPGTTTLYGPVGIGASTTVPLEVNVGTGTGEVFSLRNTNSANYVAHGFHPNGNQGYIYAFGSTYSTSGRFVADSFLIDAGTAAGLGLAASHASGVIKLYTNAGNIRLTIDAAGNIVPGTAALATTATDGFIYIPTCAGTPTGVPTTHTGRDALVFDTTNNILYTYDGGWVQVGSVLSTTGGTPSISLNQTNTAPSNGVYGIKFSTVLNNAASRNWAVVADMSTAGDFAIRQSNAQAGDPIGSGTGTTRLYINPSGNVVIGSAALATNATDGFLYIPTCAGTPTGVPTSHSGTSPLVFDTTNNILYVYDGAWTQVGNSEYCDVFNSTDQSVATATDTVMTFDSERSDTNNLHSTSTNTSRITFPVAGFRTVSVNVEFPANNAGNRRQAYIRLNGTTAIAIQYCPPVQGSLPTAFTVTVGRNFAANDYVEVLCYQDSGSSLATKIYGFWSKH